MKMHEGAFSVLKALGSSISSSLVATIANAAKAMEQLPDELRPMVRHLAERGWFVSGEMGMSELRHFQKIDSSGDNTKIDAMMSEWVEEQLERILETACTRFPARRSILTAAFSAHTTGAYELSIPVTLIQAEGMCIEVLGKTLFSTKGGTPRTKAATDALINSAFAEVILLPLRETHGLTASEDTRDNWPDAPNRHEILHGVSTDYATKLNSLKVISLLEYFVTFVADRKQA